MVPEKLQKRVLDELHSDHFGIVRMKRKHVAEYGGQELISRSRKWFTPVQHVRR